MEDTASLSYCEAWPLGNRALLGENYLLRLAPLAYYIFSVKKNDVTQPRETQRPGDKGDDDGFIVFSVPSRDVGRTQELAVLTMLLGNVQPGLTVAATPQRDLAGGWSLTALLGPSSGWKENLGT